MKKYELSKALIPIANGTWGTPKQLKRIGISQEDVSKLQAVMKDIVEKKKIIESPALNYFLALAGHYETHHIIDNGRIKREETLLPAGSWCSASEKYRNLPGRGMLDSFSIALQDLARSLIDFLYNYDYAKKMKKCPLCKKFFIAKNTKRKICYEMKCRNEYHRKDMKERRDNDPVRYC